MVSQSPLTQPEPQPDFETLMPNPLALSGVLPTAAPHAPGSRLTLLTPAALHRGRRLVGGFAEVNQGTKYVLEDSLTGRPVQWAGASQGFPKFFQEVVLLFSGKRPFLGTQGDREEKLCSTQTSSQSLGLRQGAPPGHIARQEDGRRDERHLPGGL